MEETIPVDKRIKEVSFIMTVFNEAGSIGRFIDSLFAQSLLPAEVVIVDGGSTDNTPDILLEKFKDFCGPDCGAGSFIWDPNKKPSGKAEILFTGKIHKKINVVILRSKGARISTGRNIAIANAHKEIISVSDAGCNLDRKWLESIVGGLYNDGFQVTGGYTFPEAKNVIGAVLAVCVLPKKSEINPSGFMPSSRNISFKKTAWKSVGGYPENMDYGEDMKFNFNLKDEGIKIGFNPDAEVYWNLRDDFKSVFRQFFRYAKGDAIGDMYRVRHIIRFLAFLFFLAVIILSAIFSPWLLFLLLIYPLYNFRPYSRINYVLKNSRACAFIRTRQQLVSLQVLTFFAIPFILIFIDFAKLLGYFYGIIRRSNFL